MMTPFLQILVTVVYLLSLTLLFIFSLGQLHLAWHYLQQKRIKHWKPEPEKKMSDWPEVTIQLPVFNEMYVAERLIRKVCEQNYPNDKLEIQVLDDSTDRTFDIVAELVREYQAKEINIRHIHRKDRRGYKAGALDAGLAQARGEYLAIFDSDFLPGTDFLAKTIPEFQDKKVGMVQTRWGHLNENYSLLTQLQAFGLDAHFTIEQTGRSHAGSFINFNGTAGIWRKECIVDAGGWSAETLTEDLDLSYRAQMKGWKFKYREDVVSPAELPVIMSAVKTQQFRWNKGAAETARKNLPSVFAAGLKPVHKFHALFHLLNSSVFVFLLVAALVSLPMLIVKHENPGYKLVFDIGSVFLIGFLSITLFYWIASKQLHPANSFTHFMKVFPQFLVVMMGLSFHNSVAVLEGLFGKRSTFIRTPKFNIISSFDSWKNNKYADLHINGKTIMEGLLGIYFLIGVIAGIIINDFTLIVFHLMMAGGYIAVFYLSVKTSINAQ